MNLFFIAFDRGRWNVMQGGLVYIQNMTDAPVLLKVVPAVDGYANAT
jgi:hypothetical protein